jgi:Zn finger protein HypA/HybF involved in hydrogenase expression
MIRYFLAVVSVTILVAASLPSDAAPSKAVATEAATLEIPSEIAISSSVGKVVFRHQMHIGDLGIKCANCHHQINAKQLNTPHPDYFGSSWINCKTCHAESAKIAQKAYRCSECHQTRPKNITDESLSAKVVIHKQCWKCHAVGAGKEASIVCEKCHSGKKRS